MAKAAQKDAPPREQPVATKPEPAKSEPARDSFAFPTKSRCPRCRSLNTRRRTNSPGGSFQYRECKQPICRHRYRVPGTKV